MSEMQQLTDTLQKRGEVLQATYEQAQGADRMKTNFLYNMSNQMTTPVNNINHHVKTVCARYNDLTEENVNQLIHEIRQEGEKITALLNRLITDSENIINKG